MNKAQSQTVGEKQKTLETSSEQHNTAPADPITSTDAVTACSETSQPDGLDKNDIVQNSDSIEQKTDPAVADMKDTDNQSTTEEFEEDEEAASKSAYTFCGYALSFK